MTHETVGRSLKSVGKAVKGRFTEDGRSEKSVHGTCLRAYAPEVHTSDPVSGSPSENPAKVRFDAMSSLPRFAVENFCGHESEVTP
jgi:hypothetical protein